MNRKGYIDWDLWKIVIGIVLVIGALGYCMAKASEKENQQLLTERARLLGLAKTQAETLDVELTFMRVNASRRAESAANTAIGVGAAAIGISAANAGRR